MPDVMIHVRIPEELRERFQSFYPDRGAMQRFVTEALTRFMDLHGEPEDMMGMLATSLEESNPLDERKR